MNAKTAILAIESSCDETAVALVGADGEVIDQQLFSQIQIHQAFGGVVPEVASRSHFEVLDGLVALSLEKKKSLNLELSAVAATCGPGLIGPLIVGSAYAQGLASGWQIPFIGVHHLRGHLASTLLRGSIDEPALSLKEKAERIFPAFVLLVSGGHTQVLHVAEDLSAKALAQSADDAAGECFDKAAKLMGLPYPGGPEIERIAAELSEADRVPAMHLLRQLPRPRSAEGFSFSGLKTAIRTLLEKNPELARTPRFCFAIQEAISESLCQGLDRAFEKSDASAKVQRLVFCGGVSANRRIRQRLQEWAQAHQLELYLPALKYCTDNAAMIGAAAWVQAPSLAMKEIAARQAL